MSRENHLADPERKARRIEAELKRIPHLPDSAIVSVPTAAVHDNVSESTVWRTYPLIRYADRRVGVRLGYLRNRNQEKSTA